MEHDLRIIMSTDLKAEAQCKQSCMKAKEMLGLIKKTFVMKSCEVLLNHGSPYLEYRYCISAWSPHYQK